MNFFNQITVLSPTELQAGSRIYTCQIGRNGFVAAEEKREGDGATPRGAYPLRSCYFHPEFIPIPPRTGLKRIELARNDGWCDDPTDAAYNMPVKLPFVGHHEALWRSDHAYDVIVPIGYNDAPAIPNLGSAIFLHVMHDDGRPTAGCIALARNDLLEILTQVNDATVIRIL